MLARTDTLFSLVIRLVKYIAEGWTRCVVGKKDSRLFYTRARQRLRMSAFPSPPIHEKLPITFTRVRNRLTQPGKRGHSGFLWLMTAPPFVVPRCRRYIAGWVDRIFSRNLRSGGEMSSGGRITSMSETSFRSQAVWSVALNSSSVCTQAPTAPRACATFT